jgi:integrase
MWVNRCPRRILHDTRHGARWPDALPPCRSFHRRTAHRWVKAIGKRAGLGHVHPHMLRSAFIMAALDAGAPSVTCG